MLCALTEKSGPTACLKEKGRGGWEQIEERKRERRIGSGSDGERYNNYVEGEGREQGTDGEYR